MNHLFSFLVIIFTAAAALDVCHAQVAGLITVGGSDRCMALSQASGFANGAQPQTLKCVEGAAAHTWTFASSSTSGRYLLETGDDACLDLPNGKAYNGATLQIWQCNASNRNQHFQRDGNNIRYSSKYCLDVRDGSAKNFSSHLAIQLWECNLNSANQDFTGPIASASSSIVSPSPLASSSSSSNTVAKYATPTTRAKTTTTKIVMKSTSSKRKTTSTRRLTTSIRASSSTYRISTSTSHNTTTPVTTSKASTSTHITIAPITSVSTQITSTTTIPVPTVSSVPKPALTSIFKPTAKRMLAWGFNDQYAGLIGVGTKISTYMHWEAGIVKQMPSAVTFIPTYWGPALNTSWLTVQSQFTSVPGAILGFNEPDLSSQGNVDPITAANLYYQNITVPYGLKGANMISPSISWNQTWLSTFLSACSKLGCGIDAVGMHFYVGINNNTDAAVSYISNTVNSVYARFGLPLVLGEVGLTAAGGGTDAQIADFVQKTGHFLDNSPAVLAWGLSAVFARGAGWDNYLNSNMSFFWPNNTLTPLAQSYMYDTY